MNESRFWRSPPSNTSLDFGNWRDTSSTRGVSSRLGIRSCMEEISRSSHGSVEGIWNSRCEMRSSEGSKQLLSDIRFVQDQRTKGATWSRGLQRYECSRRCPQTRNGRESEIQGRTMELPMPGIKKNKGEGESEKWPPNVVILSTWLADSLPTNLCSPLELSSRQDYFFLRNFRATCLYRAQCYRAYFHR